MRVKDFFPGAFLACGLALAGSGVQAGGTMSGNLDARMTLTASCAITGANMESSSVSFGTLDFGSQPGSFTGVLVANPTSGAGGAGVTEITCSPEVSAMSVSVSGGNNAGQGGRIGTGSRALRSGSSYLPYEVYSEPGMVKAFPANAASLGLALPGTGASVNLPVYGRINKTAAEALPAGAYVDVLQVTVSW